MKPKRQYAYHAAFFIAGIVFWIAGYYIEHPQFDLYEVYPSKINYIFTGDLAMGIGIIIDAFLILVFASEEFDKAWWYIFTIFISGISALKLAIANALLNTMDLHGFDKMIIIIFIFSIFQFIPIRVILSHFGYSQKTSISSIIFSFLILFLGDSFWYIIGSLTQAGVFGSAP